MNKKVLAILTISLVTANVSFADYTFSDASDYTGDSFFSAPIQNQDLSEKKTKSTVSRNETIPPIKKLRLNLQEKKRQKQLNNTQLAPVAPESTIYNVEVDTSEFASKELKEEFDDMMPDGFEADEEAIEDTKKAKLFKNHKNKNESQLSPENTENIVLDCDDMDYDTENYCLYANGNVNVEFVKQKTVVKADVITYDRLNNTIKAEGNVKIVKNGQVITGDYIFVDMNEENALIENPIANTANVEIHSKRGYVYGDKILQEEGSVVVDHSFPIEFYSARKGPHTSRMLLPKDQTLTNDMEKGVIRVEARDIKIEQKGDLETLAIKKLRVKKGEKTIFKYPSIKVYTNKNHDYVESNSWEIGSIRGLGLFTGPGFVFELPKGSVLKAIPMLNYKSGIGVGAVGRFSSGTNKTLVGYGTAQSKIVVHGEQRLDDNLRILYGMNDYMDEWFLGRRRPKYGAALSYDKEYASKDFLLKNQYSSFKHRLDFGYYQDIDKDRHFRKLDGTNIGTTRTRYMAQAMQDLFRYENEEKLTSVRLSVVSQLSASLYGTGDTQVIGRIGPRLHTQWRRWMQDVGYYQSAYEDNTPMPVFDAYRYGKSNLYFREYFRICRFLTLCWFCSLNLSNDSPNNREFQENAFYLSIGPDDMKFNVGYDVIRENLYMTIEMMMDAKGSRVDFDKLEIKQTKKAEKEEKSTTEAKSANEFQKDPYKAPVLQKAVVEDIKTVEDVL